MNGANLLNAKDRKVLAELDFDARQSNSQIGRKVGLSKEVVHYRIQKLLEEGVILRFHTVVNYFKLGIVKFKLYLRLTNASRKKVEEIATYFYKHPATEWVVITTGRWDMIIGFLVRNVNEFDDELREVFHRFSPYIQEKSVTQTVYLAHQTRSFLKPQKSISQVVYHTSKDKQEIIDGVDLELLRLLANNARMPVVEFAGRLHVTPRIVQYRMKELERKKIILAYKAHFDSKKIGRIFCKAYLNFSKITQPVLDNFIEYVAAIPGAIWPQRVMGGWDFELDFELENYDDFQGVLLELKEMFSELIKSQDFCIVSKEFKLDLFPRAVREIK